MNKDIIKGMLCGFAISTLIFGSISGCAYYHYQKQQEIKQAQEAARLAEEAKKAAESLPVNTDKINEIYKKIKSIYIGKIDENKLCEGIYRGMLDETLDSFSHYLTAEEFKNFATRINGDVTVGISCHIDNDCYIVDGIYESSPASKVNIETGDIIAAVNGTEITHENIAKMSELLKGEIGSEITLTLTKAADNSTKTVTVVREAFEYPSVTSTQLEDIGYIRISGFQSNTYTQFLNALYTLESKNINGFVLDLRNNNGGLTDAAIKIADTITPEGIYAYMLGPNNQKDEILSDARETELPLVVLVNENTASSAELLAGLIKASGKGKIVGKTTYGKGVGQHFERLSDGSYIALTNMRIYYMPDEITYDETGIIPDIITESTPDFTLGKLFSSAPPVLDITKDNQLKVAIETLQ